MSGSTHFGRFLIRALTRDRNGAGHEVDEETMEAQSERLYGETRALLCRQKLLTEHLVGKLLEAGEISLHQALSEIRSFEGANVEEVRCTLTGIPVFDHKR